MGESVGLAFSRYYNSRNPVHIQELGHGWSHSYASAVSIAEQGTEAVIARPDGKTYVFMQSAGTWKSGGYGADSLVELKDANGIRIGWRYTVASNDSVETYGASGKLLSIVDRAGRIQTLTYDLAARLDTVTDDMGRQLVFGYDTNNRIASVASSAGSISYGYDAQNNLVSVTYPDARSKTYHYNEAAHTSGANLQHALTGITDEIGNPYATYQYAADGKAISTGHAGGADLHTLAYNPDGTTTVTDPLGSQRSYGFTSILGIVKRTGLSQPGGSGCGASSNKTTYDVYGNVSSRTDFNSIKTCYVNDMTRNLEIARVEGLAAETSCPVDLFSYTPKANTAERKIRTTWHATLRLPTKITEAGRETSTVYDTRGNVTSTTIKDVATAKTRTRTTTYTYHATAPGVLVQKIENGPRTDVSDITTTDHYAPDENCVGSHYGCRGQVKGATNALGHVTSYNEYDAHGHVTKMTDPNGLVTTFTYTPRGWLTQRTVGSEVTVFDYDAVGQLIKLTRPDGSFVSFEYDPAHRLTATILQDGSRLTYTLDAAGNRLTDTITGPTGNAIHYTHRRTFDALGRLWQDIGAYNQTVTYEYDAKGNMKQIDGARTDVADLVRHSYDPLDRLTQTLNADSGIEQYTINALDQTTRVVDPANQATQHTINALGEVSQTVSADTGTTVRTYDTAGNRKTEKDARAITVTYSYDALNRLTQKQSSLAGTPIHKYVYDSCGAGRLCSTLIGTTTDLTLAYDAMGRIASRTQSAATTQYAYRPGGQITSITYPTNRSVTYSYDAQGRISQVATQPQSGTPVVLASTFVHGYPFAGPQSFQYGNGLAFNQSRDQDYRPVNLTDGPYQKTYSHDPAGNVASLTDISNAVQSYSYDSTGRLTGAIDTAAGSFGTLGYIYDPNGNRLSETRNASVLPYTYSPAGSNWLYQKGSDVRGKTANGNTASMSVASFTYDGYNRLATSQTAAETTTYSYNAFGERIKKINQNGLSTVFHYGNNGELLYERDQAGNTKAYVWLDGRPLARIDNDATIYYYHVDHLGTPQAMTDAAGATVWKADYEPFGKATIKVNAIENNLRFEGQYADRETGLHQNRSRDYEPGTGRYIEFDSIGLAGGSNGYRYANSNPLIFTDPTGEAAQLAWCFGGPAACAAAIGGTLAAGGMMSQSNQNSRNGAIPSSSSQSTSTTNENCPNCKATQSRSQAMAQAYAWAGMSSGKGTPIPWSDFNPPGGNAFRKGPLWADFMRQYYPPYYGMNFPTGTVEEHPFGHPGLSGGLNHDCPHFVAVNSAGVSIEFPYKPGSP